MLDWLRAVAVRFAATPSTSGLLRAIALEGAPLGVSAVIAGRRDDVRLEIIDSVGIAEDVVNDFRVLPLMSPLPATETARTGTAIHLGSREDLLDRYPSLTATSVVFEAVAAMPLVAHGEVLGTLMLVFDRPIDFDGDTRLALDSLAGMCAATLGDAPRDREVDAEGLAERVAVLERDIRSIRRLLGTVGSLAAPRRGGEGTP